MKLPDAEMKSPSRQVSAMRRSGIREVNDLASTRPGVLHLEVGEPDFPTPPHIVEAAMRALAEGYTKYTLNRGLPSLRDAIRIKLAERNGIDASVEQIVVTTGGVNALMESLIALVEPGEGILIPDPAWPNYEMMAAALHATPLRYPLERSADFEPDLDALAALAGEPHAKVIVINSPGNPTGAVWSGDTIERVLEIAREHDLYLLSDEVYEEMVFEGEHVSPATLDDEGRVISVYSASKTYAMTGWRLGYLVAAPELAELIAKVQEPVVSCAATVSQKALEAALMGPQDCVAEMREAYRRRRDVTVEALRESGLFVTEPQGAFYILADVGRATEDTYAFARWLVVEHGVAVAPGETFGSRAAGLVRLSLAAASETLDEGVARLARGVESWAAAQPVEA
jgi:aspartate/methionine/tyrosine aminotransferase